MQIPHTEKHIITTSRVKMGQRLLIGMSEVETSNEYSPSEQRSKVSCSKERDTAMMQPSPCLGVIL